MTEKPIRLLRDWSKHTFQEYFQRSRFSSFECNSVLREVVVNRNIFNFPRVSAQGSHSLFLMSARDLLLTPDYTKEKANCLFAATAEVARKLNQYTRRES